MNKPALSISNLVVEFKSHGTWHPALRGVDLSIAENETLAVVGESGSGKSVMSLSIMGLIPPGTGRIASDASIVLDGDELVGLDSRRIDRVRGNRVSMIFQEPMTSLNPTMTVGKQVGETLRVHRKMHAAAARAETLRLFDAVKIPSAAVRINDYPHQFSGGMRQRVMIAMALACRPKVLLADEPTTALDVTIQAQVLSLMDDLKREYGLSIMFITHNLGVVALIADRVAVMYAGEIVEVAPAKTLFSNPRHPYTRALLDAMPRVDRDAGVLEPIAGSVPSIKEAKVGCSYAARCRLAQPVCYTERPQMTAVDSTRTVRCWLEGAVA